MMNKLFNKTLVNLMVLLFGIFLILASGGGGGGGGSSDNNQPQNNKSLGGVELGPVKGASVAIQALDGYTLITAITDTDGYFTVDIDELKTTISRYGSDLKYVKVISTGGIDTDPNDDGVLIESEQINIQGAVTGIVPLKTLYQAKDYRINFMSTALVDILGENTDITDEKLQYIINRLGISDINGDGKIDIDDINSYKMSENNSIAETALRIGFLEYIHQGNSESRQLFIENLKYDIGFSRPTIIKEDGYYEVTLSKTSINNEMFFGVAIDENNPSFHQYVGQSLTLSYGSALFYQECSDSYGCYQPQKIFFYDNKYYYDYDYEPIQDGYEDLQRVINNLDAAKNEHQNTEQNINKLQLEIQSLDNEIAQLKRLL